MSEYINVETLDRVLSVTINRPDKKNALNHAMYGAMADAIDAAQENPLIRVVLVKALGDTFTAGNDLADFRDSPPLGPDSTVARFLRAISTAKKPLMAAVNGPAVGVGLTMLLHCDLCFASQSARFQAPFTGLGLVPEAASSMLLARVTGMAWANEILLAGRIVSADEALQLGLVSRVLSDADLHPRALQVANELAAKAPEAVQQSKALIRSDAESVAARMQRESALFAERLKSPEFTEAVTAFMQRRPAKFD